MPTIENRVSVARPVTEVFRYVAEFSNRPEWMDGLKAVHQSTDRTRLGTMLTEQGGVSALWWRLDVNADVVDFQPNRRVELKGVMGTFPYRHVYEFEFDSGGTVIREVLEYKAPIWAFPFSPLIRGAVSRYLDVGWQAVKAKLEK